MPPHRVIHGLFVLSSSSLDASSSLKSEALDGWE